MPIIFWKRPSKLIIRPVERYQLWVPLLMGVTCARLLCCEGSSYELDRNDRFLSWSEPISPATSSQCPWNTIYLWSWHGLLINAAGFFAGHCWWVGQLQVPVAPGSLYVIYRYPLLQPAREGSSLSYLLRWCFAHSPKALVT